MSAYVYSTARTARARVQAILHAGNETKKGVFNGNRGKGLDPPLNSAVLVLLQSIYIQLIANYFIGNDLKITKYIIPCVTVYVF